MMTAVLAFLSRYWQLIAVAVAALAISAVFHLALSLKAENDLLRNCLAESRAHAYSLSSSLEANRRALASREEENLALAAERAQAYEALKAAYGSSEETCAWSGERIDAVLEALGCGR
ncbi:MAG: hypothetical protein LBG06_08615 [Deltaproteobacteria bacterium]|jgi:hypothetical protein|nr:hypothetical protein [Deltaproteobacteria bacterium]